MPKVVAFESGTASCGEICLMSTYLRIGTYGTPSTPWALCWQAGGQMCVTSFLIYMPHGYPVSIPRTANAPPTVLVSQAHSAAPQCGRVHRDEYSASAEAARRRHEAHEEDEEACDNLPSPTACG